jgi:hypothetical protein
LVCRYPSPMATQGIHSEPLGFKYNRKLIVPQP